MTHIFVMIVGFLLKMSSTGGVLTEFGEGGYELGLGQVCAVDAVVVGDDVALDNGFEAQCIVAPEVSKCKVTLC